MMRKQSLNSSLSRTQKQHRKNEVFVTHKYNQCLGKLQTATLHHPHLAIPSLGREGGMKKVIPQREHIS